MFFFHSRMASNLKGRPSYITFSSMLDLIEYINKIFDCICQSSFHSNSNITSSKAQKNEVLKATCVSKKIKFIDNPTISKATHTIIIGDQWLISNNKTNSDLKVWLTKAKEAKQKEKAKLNKNWQKTNEQAGINDIWSLAIGNRQLNRQFNRMYKNILLDSPATPDKNPANLALPPELALLPATINSIGSLLAVSKEQQSKKRAYTSKQSSKLRRLIIQANKVDFL